MTITDLYGMESRLSEAIQGISVNVEIGNVGPGAIRKEVTIYSNSTVLPGADVWVTTDIGGTNTIAGTLVTNSLGSATFMLDSGVYYLWVQKSGYNFNNPNPLEVP